MEKDLRTIVNVLIGPSIISNWGISPKQSAFPRVNLHFIDEQGQSTFDGRITDCRKAIVQLDVWSKSQEELLSITRKLIPLDGHSGYGKVISIAMKFRRNDTDTTTNEVIHRSMIQYDVWFRD